jgi:hydrogenase maturation protease
MTAPKINTVKILVLGIGQSLRGDDGAGIAAIQHWQEVFPESADHPSVSVGTSELPGISLLDDLSGYQAAILVDAVRSGAEAGHLHLLVEADLAAFAAGSTSAHGLGVSETLALGRKLYPDQLPQTVILIGIEAGTVELGDSLSEEVRRALPRAAQLIESQLRDWLNREIRE